MINYKHGMEDWKIPFLLIFYSAVNFWQKKTKNTSSYFDCPRSDSSQQCCKYAIEIFLGGDNIGIIQNFIFLFVYYWRYLLL